MKGAKIILHAKSPTFKAAKLKGFTVFTSHVTAADLTTVDAPIQFTDILLSLADTARQPLFSVILSQSVYLMICVQGGPKKLDCF